MLTDVLLALVVVLLLVVCGWLAVLTHLVLGLRPADDSPATTAVKPTRPPADPSTTVIGALGRHAERPTPRPRTATTETPR